MTPAETITRALELGALRGVEALSQAERIPFLISEAEVYCDKDGIDSMLVRYGVSALPAFAAAFNAAGSRTIAEALLALAADAGSEASLSRANELICQRVGYSYESICDAVAGKV